MSPAERDPGYASLDLATRPLYLAGLALALLIVIALGIVLVVFRGLERSAVRHEPPSHPLAQEELPPEPRLLVDPDRHRAEYIRAQRERVEGYEWIDRENGVVRIPLERALELVAREGLPVR